MKNKGGNINPSRTIVLCANTSWHLWNFRRQTAASFQELGWKVVFVAPPDEYSDKLSQMARFVPLALCRYGYNPFREIQSLFRIIGIFRREKPDIVLSWTPKPNIYCSFASQFAAGVRVIPNVSGLGFAFIKAGWMSRVVGLLYKLAFRRSETVFFQNSDDRNIFVRSKWVPAGAAKILPGSGVDLNRFRASPPRSDPDFVFLFAGRLLSDKGLRELVDVRKILHSKDAQPNHTVRIVGFVDEGNPTGIKEPEIRGWETAGLVEFHGPTDRIENLIKDADCVVLPSYREGMPRILLEAAASARPVITTNTIGCRDAVLDGVTGFLCEANDVESLANAMRKMLNLTVDQRDKMGKAARTLAEERFSEDIVISAYIHEISKKPFDKQSISEQACASPD